MDRRAFISGLTVSFLATPLAAGAQQARTAPRIALLAGGSRAADALLIEAFWRRMNELGYVEGKNVVGLGSTTFRHVLTMGYGQPKHVMESGDVQRQSLVFLGIKPWENDNMKEMTDRMIQMKADEERVRALEAAKPSVTIDVTKGDSDEVPETLERVDPGPPPDPSAYR